MPEGEDDYADYLFSQPEPGADEMYYESLAETNFPRFFEPDEISSHFLNTFEFTQLKYRVIDLDNSPNGYWLSVTSCNVLEIKTKGPCNLEYIINHAGKTYNGILNPQSPNEEQIWHLYKYDLEKVASLSRAQFLLQEDIYMCLKLWEPDDKHHKVYIGIFNQWL
jgi:hypothetical protein